MNHPGKVDVHCSAAGTNQPAPSLALRNRRRGAVLVVTLGVMAALVAIVAAIAANQRVAARAQINRMEARRARLAAEAGIHRVMAELQLQEPNLTGTTDAWAVLGNIGSERFVLGSTSFRLEVRDAASFINLNTASQEQLERLPLTTEQIDSLLDWRSPELTPRTEGGKDEYYNNLTNPYNAKLRNLDSLDEVLLVKGFTPAAIYDRQENIQTTATLVQGSTEEQPTLFDIAGVDSTSSNTTVDGQTKLNVNTASVQQMTQRGIAALVATQIVQRRNTQGTFTTLGDVLRVPGVNQNNAGPIIDNLMIGTAQTVQGKININTATEPVLNSIPDIQPDMAAAIVARQTTPFNSLSELLSVPGFSLQVLQQTVDLFTVNSQTFIVRVIGTAGQTSVALQATVLLDGQTPRLLKVEEMPFDNMWSRWGWEETTTTEIVLSEDQ